MLTGNTRHRNWLPTRRHSCSVADQVFNVNESPATGLIEKLDVFYVLRPSPYRLGIFPAK